MELVKTSRPLAAIFGPSLCTKRTAKICFGLIAAVFLLQFYYVRELVFMEAVVALGFRVGALRLGDAQECTKQPWTRGSVLPLGKSAHLVRITVYDCGDQEGEKAGK